MFWRKKKIVAAPAKVGSASVDTAALSAAPVADAGTAPAKVGAEKVEKLPGPKTIPEILGNYLIKNMAKEPRWVWRLSAVMRPRAGGEQGFDVRIFADYEAMDRKVKVKDYTTLDQYPKLILYEGWFDKQAKKVDLEEKRAMPKITIYTEQEIRNQVEALTEANNKIHFYLSSSPASGGPLERGAALVELNPDYPAKGKKYILTAVSVDGMEPTGKGIKMFDSNDPKYVARWIKERHFKASG